MRIDFFFLWKWGRKHRISPYQIYVYYEIGKKEKEKRSYQIYVYNEIEKRKEKKKRNDRVN